MSSVSVVALCAPVSFARARSVNRLLVVWHGLTSRGSSSRRSACPINQCGQIDCFDCKEGEGGEKKEEERRGQRGGEVEEKKEEMEEARRRAVFRGRERGSRLG